MDAAKEKQDLSRERFSFDAESKDDIVGYFSFLAGEINNLLKDNRDKREALAELRIFQAGGKQDDDMKKFFPSEEKTQQAINKLESDLAELSRAFEIVETLFNSIIEEVKSRLNT